MVLVVPSAAQRAFSDAHLKFLLLFIRLKNWDSAAAAAALLAPPTSSQRDGVSLRLIRVDVVVVIAALMEAASGWKKSKPLR